MNWKEKLLKVREGWYLNKYQAVKDFGIFPPKPYDDRTVNSLTRCIMDWLKFNGQNANRLNSQGQVRLETVQLSNGGSYKKANWTRGTPNPDTPDINAIINGRSVAIKVICKDTNDCMRPQQVREKQHVESSGVLYVIATNMESFINFYEQTFTNISQHSLTT